MFLCMNPAGSLARGFPLYVRLLRMSRHAREHVHVRAECETHRALLTLVVNVLVLVHFPVHVRVRVRVNVRVDLRVDLGSQSSSSLRQEQLLVGNVVLIRNTVFVPVGRLRRQRGAGSVAARHR